MGPILIDLTSSHFWLNSYIPCFSFVFVSLVSSFEEEVKDSTLSITYFLLLHLGVPKPLLPSLS